MKKDLKKFLGVMCLALAINAPADAGFLANKVPMLCYADITVPTYDKPDGKRVGFISPNVSLVLIKEIRNDGWAYGSYPIAGGKRHYRWFQMQELQGYWNFNNYDMEVSEDMIVYRTTAMAARTGSLVNKQKIVVVGEKGDYLKIVYRVSGGAEYKMGWIYKNPPSSDENDPSTDPDNPSNGGDGNNLPITVNVTIENNPTIQNTVEVNSTNTNTNTSTNTNTNSNQNSNENSNENTNENSNSNSNNNENNNNAKNKGATNQKSSDNPYKNDKDKNNNPYK